MFTINTATISGNLGSAPERIADGKGCRFSLAVNERVKKGDNDYEDYVNWVEVTAWGSLADQLVKQLDKGSALGVSGRLREQRWEKDGQKRSKVGLTAERVFIPKGGNGSAGDSDVPADTAGLGGSAPDPDSDIPFRNRGIPDREMRRRDLFTGDRWIA